VILLSHVIVTVISGYTRRCCN